MRHHLHKLVILCCALYLSGAHWMVLQTTAWTGMVVSRSFNAGVATAVETTFDGQHPCRMCTAIAEGQKEEQGSQKDFAVLKKAGDVKFVEMRPLSLDFILLPDGMVHWPSRTISRSSRTDAPPTPPPLA